MTASITEPNDLLRAFEHAGDGVFAVDWDLRIVHWDERAARLLGFARAEVLGKRCDEVIGGFDRAGRTFCGPDCSVVRCARRGCAVESYDLHAKGRRGEPRWLNVSIVVLRGRRRRSTVIVHLIRDVTESRRVEVAAERVFIGLTSGDRVRPQQSPGGLTLREAEVLRLLACGMTNAKIAETLGISATTVRNHIEHLLAKLGVHSKLEAVVYAARHRIV